MPVEQPNTTLRDTMRPQAIPLPGDQIVTTDGTIKQLQIPDEVALRPENVIPFLASQSAKLAEICARPEIKTLAAEIPEYRDNENAPMASALSGDERSALSDWHKDMARVLSTASGDGGSLDQIKNDIQNYIDDAMKNHPEMFQDNGGANTPDVLEQWLTGQMATQTDDQKKKYQELMALASRGADPDSIILAMTYRQAQESQNKMGKLLEVYKTNMDSLDQMRAELDLSTAKGDISQADMMKKNMDFSRYQADSMNLFQCFQKEFGNYERIMQSGQSLEKSGHEADRTMLQNLKA